MCTFYHTTNRSFKVGDQFSTDDFDGDTTYDHANRKKQDKAINYQMDEKRPHGALSRTKCIYLFDNFQFCMQYACSMKYGHIYEVLPVGSYYGPCPMSLVTITRKCSQDQIEKVIEEYWLPKQQWNIHEYLASKIKFVKDLSFNHSDVITNYSEDFDKAIRMFPSMNLTTNIDSGRHCDLYSNL